MTNKLLLLIIMSLIFSNSYAKNNCTTEMTSLLNFACEREETWSFGIGFSAESGGAADASKKTESSLEAGIIAHGNFNWGQYFFDGQETGVRIYPSQNFNFMIGARLEPGRVEDDDDKLLEGQGDSPDKVMGRAEVRYNLYGNWNTWAGVSSLVGDEDIGYLHILVLAFGINKTKNFDTELSISQRYGSTAFIDKDFGVNSKQSSRNGLDEYSASDGWQSSAIQLTSTYTYQKDFFFLLNLGYDQYDSRLKKSPIIKRGRDNESEISLTALYLF